MLLAGRRDDESVECSRDCRFVLWDRMEFLAPLAELCLVDVCLLPKQVRPILPAAIRKHGCSVGRHAEMTAAHISMSVQTSSGNRV